MPRTYDEVAPHYDRAIRPLERWFLARLRDKAFRQLPEQARILEIGAGTGLNFVFYPPSQLAVATEPSKGMLAMAQAKAKPAELRLLRSCAEHLPFKDDSFDAAFATLVFCSVAHPGAAFGELRRVVKPGGAIVLLEHVRPNGLLGLLFDFLNLFTVRLFDDHFNRRTVAEARASGIQVIGVERSLLGIINLIACRV